MCVPALLCLQSVADDAMASCLLLAFAVSTIAALLFQRLAASFATGARDGREYRVGCVCALQGRPFQLQKHRPFCLAGGEAAARMCLAPAQTLSKRREVGSFPTPSYNKLKLFTRHGKRKKRHDIEVLSCKQRFLNPSHILFCSEFVLS